MKKFFKIVLALVIVLVGAMLIIPVLFKSQVIEIVEKEANNSVNAKIELREIDLSLFSDFPNLTLEISDFSVQGVDSFQEVSLAKIGNFKFEIDLASLLSGSEIKIVDVSINDAFVNVLVMPSGKANYDIAKPAESNAISEGENTEAAENSDFSLSLKSYSLNNFNLSYIDKQGKVSASIKNLNHSGSGDFTQAVVDIKTLTSIESLSASAGGVNFLTQASVDSKADVEFNSESSTVTFGENYVSLNALKLAFTGEVKMLEEGFDLNVKASTPSTDFKEVLSLVPTLYMHDFDGLKTSGSFQLGFMAKGVYSEESMPAFNLDLNLNNGSFSYPSLPAKAEEIKGQLLVNHPGGDLDKMKVDINGFYVKLGRQPLSMDMHLENVMSNIFVDLKAAANIDLATIEQVMPIDSLEFAGLLDFDLTVKGRQKDFENQNIDKVELQGVAHAKNLVFTGELLPKAVSIRSGSIEASPSKASVKNVEMVVGNSDFSFYGTIDNLAAFALSDDLLKANFVFNSKVVDLNEWMEEVPQESSEEVNEETTESASLEVIPVPDNLDLALVGSIEELNFSTFPASKINAKITVKDARASIENGSMNAMGGSLTANGYYDTKDLSKPEVSFDMTMKNMDMKAVTNTMSMVKSMAPALESATGNFNASMSMKSILKSDMMPDLNQLSASGLLNTKGIGFAHKTLEDIANLVKNDNYKKIRFQDALITFQIENGRLYVEPFEMKIGGYKGTFEGSSGIDKTMDYTWRGEVPVKDVTLGQSLPDFLNGSANIPLEIYIKGTTDSPVVSLGIGGSKGQLGDVVKDLISDEIEKATEKIKDEVNQAASNLVLEAEKAGDDLIVQAQAKADQIKTDARREGDKILADVNKEIKRLENEAKGNFFAEEAAKIAGEKLRKEAKAKVDELVGKANKDADQLVENAKKEKIRLVEEAKKKASVK